MTDVRCIDGIESLNDVQLNQKWLATTASGKLHGSANYQGEDPEWRFTSSTRRAESGLLLRMMPTAVMGRK
jgi:hypothetical protein